MEKPRKLITRQYFGFVRDLNARMAQIPPLFDENQELDESELVDSLANKAWRSHKAMLISQGFNPETIDLETFAEHWKQAETTENIAGAIFLPQTRTPTPRERKSALGSKNGTKMVRNIIRNNIRFIALSMVKTKATPLGSANSSNKGLKTSLSIQQRITR